MHNPSYSPRFSEGPLLGCGSFILRLGLYVGSHLAGYALCCVLSIVQLLIAFVCKTCMAFPSHCRMDKDQCGRQSDLAGPLPNSALTPCARAPTMDYVIAIFDCQPRSLLELSKATYYEGGDCALRGLVRSQPRERSTREAPPGVPVSVVLSLTPLAGAGG